MDWNELIGGFFQGYKDTMATRHKERAAKFDSLMDLSKQWSEVASRERSKPVQNENSRAIIRSAEEQSQKYMQDAEKEMNRKIGGIQKLGGMLKGVFMGGGESKDVPGQGDIPPDTPLDQLEAPPEESPAAQTTIEEMPAPPNVYLPGTASAGSGAQMRSLAPPPGRPTVTGPFGYPTEGYKIQPKTIEEIPMPADINRVTGSTLGTDEGPLSLPGMKPGEYVNPELYAQEWVQQDIALRNAERRGDVDTAIELKRKKKLRQQEIKMRSEEFDQFEQGLRDSGYDDQAVEKAKISYILGNPNLLKSTVKTEKDTRPYFDEEAQQWVQRVFLVNEDGTRTDLMSIPTSPPNYITNLSARMQEKVKNYMAANKGATPEVAEREVRSREEKLLANKLKSAQWKAVSDEALADYRKNRTKYYKEAQAAKEQGSGMSVQTALNMLKHADSFAKVDLQNDILGMDVSEAHAALLEASNAWLMDNVGISREEVRQIIRNKGIEDTPESRTKAAKDFLLSPPKSEGATGNTGGSPAKKSGDISPP